MHRRAFLTKAGATTLGALAAPALHAAQAYEIPEALHPQDIRTKERFEPNTLIVTVQDRRLYHFTEERRARRYVVAVGKEGLNFKGSAVIGRKVEWPSWTPTPAMIERSPSYARWADGMKGGPNNPLGARALYLYRDGRDTAFRIHGTTEPRSIGAAASNGCIRMFNEQVIELYERIPLGMKVTVI